MIEVLGDALQCSSSSWRWVINADSKRQDGKIEKKRLSHGKPFFRNVWFSPEFAVGCVLIVTEREGVA